MTPCQKLLKQEGTARRIESMQQSSATQSLHLWFLGVAEDCCMLSILLAVPSCFNSFWHGVIPTSYFIFNDFYTCIYTFSTCRCFLSNSSLWRSGHGLQPCESKSKNGNKFCNVVFHARKLLMKWRIILLRQYWISSIHRAPSAVSPVTSLICRH